jgi:sulfide:quinone oxidoreductase
MDMTQLASNVFVGPQIAESDLTQLANAGFTDVVCNRPDAEHPNEAASTRMADLAKGLGLAFHYHPITPGQPFDSQASVLSRLASDPGAKVFAYCRSGARSSAAWARATA